MESYRPHRPSKLSILSHTDLTQSLQSSTTDPTDILKEYLFSIWTHTDPTDLPKLAYWVTQTSHRPCKVLPETPQTFIKNIYLVYGVTQTLQSSTTDPTPLYKEYLFRIWSHTDHTDLPKLAYWVTQTSHRHCKLQTKTPQTFKKNIYLLYGVTQTTHTFQN